MKPASVLRGIIVVSLTFTFCFSWRQVEAQRSKYHLDQLQRTPAAPTLISSSGRAGAYPWIGKQNNVYVFLLRICNIKNGFSVFLCQPGFTNDVDRSHRCCKPT